MNEYMTVLKKYAVFNGRASRKEFWMFVLFYIIISVILAVVGSLLGDKKGIIVGLYSLALFIPSLAAAVRRLHDIGKSGWWVLIGLVPVIGGLALIYFYVLDSQPGQNQYGANPKGV